jgi:hypothetical protein
MSLTTKTFRSPDVTRTLPGVTLDGLYLGFIAAVTSKQRMLMGHRASAETMAPSRETSEEIVVVKKDQISESTKK